MKPFLELATTIKINDEVILKAEEGGFIIAELVINEQSRRGRELAESVRSSLRERGIHTYENKRSDDVSSVECIIVAGGDGTVVCGIGDAISRGLPVGIVPLGTFNDLARTLGIPLGVDAACDVIAQRHECLIDVGTVNGHYFVNEASIGISSRITRLQTPEIKQHFGLFGVVWTALRAFQYSRAIHAEVSFDGKAQRLRTVQMTVANSDRFGGIFKVEDAAIDDGWLDLYSVDIKSFRQAFAIARAIFAGKHHHVPGFRQLRSTQFDVRTKHPHHITADGEPAGVTPAIFRILPKTLRVFAPPLA